MSSMSDFMARLRSPACSELRDFVQTSIKKFNQVDIPELLRRGDQAPGGIVRDVMRNVVSRMKAHREWAPLFEDADSAEGVKECLEKAIVVNVYPNAFSPSDNDRRLDAQLSARIVSLRFLEPRHFDVPDSAQTPSFAPTWEAAAMELQRIDGYKAPRDKMVCIQNACRLLFELLSTSAAVSKAERQQSTSVPAPSSTSDSSSPPEDQPTQQGDGDQDGGPMMASSSSSVPHVDGSLTVTGGRVVVSDDSLASADDFLPALILTVLRANPDRLHSNLAFIREYRDPAAFTSEAGYCFTHLLSAVQFIQSATASGLSISEEEFAAGLATNTPVGISMVPSPGSTPVAAAGSDAAAAAGTTAPATPPLPPVETTRAFQPPLPAGATPDARVDAWCAARFRFQSTVAADLRISDVQDLLAEYNNLVSTCSRLLAERRGGKPVRPDLEKELEEEATAVGAGTGSAAGAGSRSSTDHHQHHHRSPSPDLLPGIGDYETKE